MEHGEKKKISIGYMILSLLIAIAIWLFVAYSTGAKIQRKIHINNINYIGEEQLVQNGLVIVNKGEVSGLQITAEGKRDDLADTFNRWEIEVDVSGITSAGEHDVTARVSSPDSDVDVARQRFENVHVKVEKIVEKEIPVEIQTPLLKGKLVKTTPDKEKVLIRGAESEVDRVSSARAVLSDVGLEAVESSVALPLSWTDKHGEPVIPPPETISSDDLRVTVMCTVYDQKTLPIVADLSGAKNSGFTVDEANTRITPASLTIGVLPGSNIESIRAEVTEISDKETECALIEEEGMYIPGTTDTVTVRLSVTPKDN